MASVRTQPRPPVHDRELNRADEPPPWGADTFSQRIPLIVALRRHPMWVVVPAVLLLLAGIAAGFARSPTYTAESSLIIGSSDPASPNFSGNVVAAGSLATAYSRAIVASPVVNSVSRRLHLSRDAVTASLSSAPVPGSPEFRVVATGKSSRVAIDLANATSAAVIRYLGSINSGSVNQQRMLSTYQAAAVKLNQDVAALDALQSKLTPDRAAIIAAKAQHDKDQLLVSGLGGAYNAALQANPPSTGVSSLTTAFAASSDRKANAELLGFIGLVGGALVGVALAARRGSQEVRQVARS